MSLQIAWVTPFGPKSDIGAFSRNILHALAPRVEKLGGRVTLVINQNGPSYWSDLPTIELAGTPHDAALLRSFDVVIFNIGNNSNNHRHINFLALHIPGIVIVHDLVMRHFLAQEIFDARRRTDFYARLIGEYYGEAGLETIEHARICHDDGHAVYAPWDSTHVAAMPLLEPFIDTAAAVVVHSAYADDFVTRRRAPLTLRLALPWDQKIELSAEDLKKWRTGSANIRSCSVVSFGHIGRGKCLEVLISAFGESPQLRTSAHLIIAGYPGDAQYLEELQAMVKILGIENRVSFELAVSDQRLLAIKRGADLFVNLRHPNTESASGSLIEQLATGKPVLVYPTGCYAELAPDQAVLVDRDEGVAAVRRAIESMAASPRQRIRIGAGGRAYARRTGREDYANTLIRFIRTHRDLLRARISCAAGVRTRIGAITADDPGQDWLTRLTSARRLMDHLHRDRRELAADPFLHWPPRQLMQYVAIGLFGGSTDTRLYLDGTGLLAQLGRGGFHTVTALAHGIFTCGKLGSDGGQFLALTAAPMLDPNVWRLLHSLPHDHVARALYIGILGRYPAHDEIQSYGERLAAENFAAVLREFLFSAEFRARGAAESAVTALIECCDGDYFGPQLAGRVEPGHLVHFSTQTPHTARLLLSGWHGLEDYHVWSSTARAQLQFALPTWHNGGRITIQCEARFTGTEFTGFRDLRFGIVRIAESAFSADHDGWFTIALEIDLAAWGQAFLGQAFLGGDAITLFFDTGYTINMADLTGSPDQRELGICIRSLIIRETPRAQENQPANIAQTY